MFFFLLLFQGSDLQVPAELLEKADMSTLVIINVALAALGVLIVNAALVAFFIIRRRNKGLFLFLFYCHCIFFLYYYFKLKLLYIT